LADVQCPIADIYNFPSLEILHKFLKENEESCDFITEKDFQPSYLTSSSLITARNANVRIISNLGFNSSLLDFEIIYTLPNKEALHQTLMLSNSENARLFNSYIDFFVVLCFFMDIEFR
jgi:hypothetical protein